MARVLGLDDTGRAVIVLPTKALVNQLAAQVRQAIVPFYKDWLYVDRKWCNMCVNGGCTCQNHGQEFGGARANQAFLPDIAYAL